MSEPENREVRLNMNKNFIDKIEKAFCLAEYKNQTIQYRTLVSVAKEAFVKGIHAMCLEKELLVKSFGKGVYLTEGGVQFMKDLLEIYNVSEQPQTASD